MSYSPFQLHPSLTNFHRVCGSMCNEGRERSKSNIYKVLIFTVGTMIVIGFIQLKIITLKYFRDIRDTIIRFVMGLLKLFHIRVV